MSMDNAAVIVGLFMIAASIFVAFKVVDVGHDAFTNDANANNLMNNAETMFVRMGNSGFLFMTFGLVLFNIIGAFLLFTHPVFVILDILFMPIGIVIAAVLSNAYEASIYTLSGMSNFTIMNFIMLHLPLEIVIMDVLVAIAAYALIKNNF